MQPKQKNLRVFNAKNAKVGVVVARFNQEITEGLLNSAVQALQDFKVLTKNTKVVWVAGAIEIPVALQKLANTKKYNCLVVLGCVIRGETPHFEYVCKMAQEGVLRVILDYHVPVGFGIITVENFKQAKARLHLGAEAVAAALEVAQLKI